MNGWKTTSPFISTVMGIEENFLLRFGDVNIDPNQLQLAGGGYPATPGLIAYWKFNEGTGSSIKDYGPNNFTYSLSGAPTWVAGVKCPE